MLVGATHVAALSWKLGWLEGPRWPPSSDWKLVQALGLAGVGALFSTCPLFVQCSGPASLQHGARFQQAESGS